MDAYSCVNRQEDRARIMEYFMTRDDEAGILIQSPFIHQKLRIMCDAVPQRVRYCALGQRSLGTAPVMANGRRTQAFDLSPGIVALHNSHCSDAFH